MTAYDALKQKLESNDATVGIIGLGYVGLPLAAALHDGGLGVIGFDVDSRKIESLERGENYLKHLGDELTRSLSQSDRFEATADMGRLSEADVILVCLPTPVGAHQEPDLSYIVGAGTSIGQALRPGQLVVLESTTYPGTTRGEFLGEIERVAQERGLDLVSGKDFFVAFSPEREDPGRSSHNTSTIPKLVGGLDPQSTQLATLLYRKGISEIVEVSSAEVAEAAKLLENIFRAVNIAMVNEMKTILTDMNVDIWEVIRAASTKPFGFMPFFPGPGLGGHCIPVDPFYLSWKAREFGRRCQFIELAGTVNTEMPDYVIERVTLALNQQKKSVNGSKALVLGLAYKSDVDDTRESPSFEIIEKLKELGAEVSYSDPHIPQTSPVRRHDLGMKSAEITAESVRAYERHRGCDRAQGI